MENLIYQKNSAWNLLFEKGALVISGGADELYLVDELSKLKSELIFTAYQNDTLHQLNLNDIDIQTTINRWEKMRVIFRSAPGRKEKDAVKVALKWWGEKNIKLERWLFAFCETAEGIFIA